MNCVICKHGTLSPGFTTVVLTRGATTVVIKDVPADICGNCGEYYLTPEMSEKIAQLAEDAIKKGAEIEIIRYAA